MPGTFGSGIKSVQRGEVTLDANPDTVTITAVVLAKSFVLITQTIAGGDSTQRFARAVLTNTTTITIAQATTDAGVVAWQVIEFY